MGSLKLHGKIDMEARNRSVERFLQEADRRALATIRRVAKKGLMLKVANDAVFSRRFDRNFSSNGWPQVQGRMHRTSRSKSCRAFYLLAKGSIDGWGDEILPYRKHLTLFAQGNVGNDNVQENSSNELKNITKEALQS